MISAAVVVLGLAAIGGLTLAGMRLAGEPSPTDLDRIDSRGNRGDGTGTLDFDSYWPERRSAS